MNEAKRNIKNVRHKNHNKKLTMMMNHVCNNNQHHYKWLPIDGDDCCQS